MTTPLLEILRLVAEGLVSPDEGAALVRALAAGDPAEVGVEAGMAVGPQLRSGREEAPPRSPRPAPDREQGEDRDASPVPGAPLRLLAGQGIELGDDTVLRIETPGREVALDDALTSVAVRGLPTQKLTLIRGTGVEVRQSGSEIFLTWPRGLLLLEVPLRLRALEIRHLGGGVGVSGYSGPFTIEEIEGPLTVHDPKSPFRIRGVRGPVRIHGLGLRDGISTIAQVGAEVEVETAPEAAVTIRADSSDGGVSFGEDPDGLGGSGPSRRGVWRVGAGTAQLEISGVRGRILLQRTPPSGERP